MLYSQYPSFGYLVVDGTVLTTVIVCAVSSILCEFSDIKTSNQFNKLTFKHSIHFSMGQDSEHCRYFFQLTLWNLWLAVIGYIVIWDMLIRRLLLQNKSMPIFQRMITRVLSTIGLSIAFIYWSMLGIPKVLNKQATPFKLINTFGLHFLILVATLAYYFARNKVNLINKEKCASKEKQIIQSHLKMLSFETQWQYYLLLFYCLAIIFSISSYISQFYLTRCIPVYDGIVDWRHPLIAGTICLITPLLFTSIFYVMHTKNKYTHFLRGFIIIFITACMSFTMSYGLVDNCLHYDTASSWVISLTITVLLSLSSFAFYHSNKDGSFETLFPPLEDSKYLAYNTNKPVECLQYTVNDK